MAVENGELDFNKKVSSSLYEEKIKKFEGTEAYPVMATSTQGIVSSVNPQNNDASSTTTRSTTESEPTEEIEDPEIGGKTQRSCKDLKSSYVRISTSAEDQTWNAQNEDQGMIRHNHSRRLSIIHTPVREDRPEPCFQDEFDDDMDSDELDMEQDDQFKDLPDLFFQNKSRLSENSAQLSSADIEICQRLDLEYERALEEREIAYHARYRSVRQSAAFIILFMFFYLACGTAFFNQVAGWDIHNALFFCIYTMTTVGYGLNDNIPNRSWFLLSIIFLIFVGIATLTIMIAQVYQYVALESTRAQHERERIEMNRKGSAVILAREKPVSSKVAFASMMEELDTISRKHSWDYVVKFYDRLKWFFGNSEVGKSLSVIFPFAGLIFIGAAVVGPIEGWTVIESLYFASVSMTTVGYGLYHPTNKISIYFCIFWLPFSVGFMSMYLSKVAAFYIRLSDRSIYRIEKQLRRRIKRAKQQAARDFQNEILSRSIHVENEDSSPEKLHSDINQQNGFERLDNEDSNPHPHLGMAFVSGERRRTKIINRNKLQGARIEGDGATVPRIQSMRDIIRTVRRNLELSSNDDRSLLDDNRSNRSLESEFLSIRSLEKHNAIGNQLSSRDTIKDTRKPTFALRILVQERFAEIIATEIAGFHSNLEIEDNTLCLTIDSLKETAEKWMIPSRARKAFRSVAFESLCFVGERGLITRGPAAMFDLTPLEFHGLFAPLLAAMGDAETMEGWLASTDILADVDLHHDVTVRGSTDLNEIGDESLLSPSLEKDSSFV
jgi:Ion channel